MSPVQLRHIYDYVAERDPYHVILSASRSGDRYSEIADWFETHPYINAHYDSAGNRLYGRDFRDLGSFVDAFHPTEHPDKCFGGLPTCFTYPGADYPTFDEYVLNYWCEFVRGAKTMYPYAYHDLGDRPTLYEGTRYMFESIQALEDVILFGTRKTLVKTRDYECCLWTMPGGERMFAAVNFTSKPQTFEVPDLAGSYREFRGTRTFKFRTLFTMFKTPTVDLKPLEALIACESDYDTGLKTLNEVKRMIADMEYARTHRGNQLGGRHEDMDVITSEGRRGAWYDSAIKVFDGTLDVVAWRSDSTDFSIRQPAKRSFLTFELGKPEYVQDNAYTFWLMSIGSSGTLCSEVSVIRPGLYTLSLPPAPKGVERNAQLQVYDKNVRFGMGTVTCSEEPANYAFLTETNGAYAVRVKLAAPCEDVVCSFYEDTGRGQRVFRLSTGRSSLDLRPTDASRTVWEGSVPVTPSADAKRKPFPYIRVTVLGGTLATPIYTWLAK